MAFDVFGLRDHVVREYREYVESFIHIRDQRIERFVQDTLARGELWPDAVLQTQSGIRARRYARRPRRRWPDLERRRREAVIALRAGPSTFLPLRSVPAPWCRNGSPLPGRPS